MKSLVLLLLTILTFSALSARGAVIATYLFSMDQDPTTQGWTVIQGGGGSHSVSGGILTINSATYYELTAPGNLWNDNVRNRVGWQVETRMRIVDSAGPSLRIWVDDNTVANILDINPDSLVLNGGTNNPSYNYHYNVGMDFHTYLLKGIGQNIDVFVDGNHVIDVLRPTPAEGIPHKLFFGDGYFGRTSISEWDYFKFTTELPEPATTAILLFASIAALRPASRARKG